MNGQVPQVELNKGEPNFSTNWRGILEIFGITRPRVPREPYQ